MPGVRRREPASYDDRSKIVKCDPRVRKGENRDRGCKERPGVNGCLAERAGANAFVARRAARMRRLKRDLRGTRSMDEVEVGLGDEGLESEGNQQDERHGAPAGTSAATSCRSFCFDSHWPIDLRTR